MRSFLVVILLHIASAGVRPFDVLSSDNRQRRLTEMGSLKPRTTVQSDATITSAANLSLALRDPKTVGKKLRVNKKRLFDRKSEDTLKKRRLDEGSVCQARTDCGENEYCMSCKKCKAYASDLSAQSQIWWSCDPCSTDEEAFCENGRYCGIANDPMEDACPAQFKGCDSHAQCGDNGYCYSCDVCVELALTHEWLKCAPCPTTLGGYCDELHRCDQIADSIDGACPQPAGCSTHTDCSSGSYCESCDRCSTYLDSLDQRSRSSWSCYPCPSRNGGICELERFCRVANDGIDGTCPVSAACSQHDECGKDEYCMGCTQCATYRESISNPSSWSCDPCPTDLGGVCEIGKFCSVAKDAIDGVCPPFAGCDDHKNCANGSFCMKYDTCIAELNEEQCGERPTMGGFCLRREFCTVTRSITASCDSILSGCSHHEHCISGEFCTSWAQCEITRGIGFCGERPTNEGVCLSLAHCQLGLHTPLDGECPLQASTAHPNLVTREVLKFDGPLNLATFHQAVNVWYDADEPNSKEHLVLQLHDYGEKGKRHDDLEYFASYTIENGVLAEEWRVPTSCPYVEMIVPHRGPYVYEARVAMSQAELDLGLHDCSCLSGNFEWSTPGVCPRGVQFNVSAPTKVHTLQFGNLHQFSIPTNTTLYTMQHEVKGIGFYVDGEGCPLRSDGTQYDWKMSCEDIKNGTQRIEGVAGKWCTVDEGGCAPTLKYKLCWASGAIGFVLVANESSTSDRSDAILLTSSDSNSTCGTLIPAVYIQGIDASARAAFTAGTMEIAVGPSISAPARKNHTSSSGGMHVYDTVAHRWVHHFELFGGIQYAETSPIRDVLFVCASNSSRELNTLRSFDISPYVMEETARDYRCGLTNADEILLGEMVVARCKDACAMDLRCMAVNVNMDMMEAGVVPCYAVRVSKPIHPQKVALETQPHGEFRFQCFHKIGATEPGPRMVEIVRAHAPKCRKGGNRDYHVVDFARGKRFYTTLIDPEDKDNRLYIYDTTDLSNWKLQDVVHANWEDADSGLGQVVASFHGDRHVITWHCSNVYCTGSFGHTAYILDTSDPHEHVAIEQVLALPMKEGTFARDVGCNENDLCLVTLNHDGLVLIDLAGDGPAIVASHAETFSDDHIPVPVYRMFSGAQKVYPSKKDSNVFYVESSTLDWSTLVNGSSLTRAVSFDSVYTVEIQPEYKRGGASVTLVDPIVTAAFTVNQSWQNINALLSTSALEESGLQEIIIDSFATATREKASRFKVIGTGDRGGHVQSTFEILPGDGPSPLTIYTTLERQLKSNHSAIHKTRLAPLLSSAELRNVLAPMDTRTPRQHRERPDQLVHVYIGHNQVLYLSLLVGFIFVCCVAFGLVAWRKHREVRKLRADIKSRAFLSPTRSAVVSGQIEDGFVIGRPAAPRPRKEDDSDTDLLDDLDCKKTPPADNIQVVGEPVRLPTRGPS